MDIVQIEEMIIQIITKITGVIVENKDENLFGRKYAIAPRDMMYIIQEIEKQIGKEVTDIFATNDSGIMTVNNLGRAIYQKGCKEGL